jgi:hypothetical protein
MSQFAPFPGLRLVPTGGVDRERGFASLAGPEA